MVLQGKRCQGPDQDPASQNQSQDHPQDQDQGLHPDQCQGQNQGPPQDQYPDRGQSQRKAQETRVQFLDPQQAQVLQPEEVGDHHSDLRGKAQNHQQQVQDQDQDQDQGQGHQMHQDQDHLVWYPKGVLGGGIWPHRHRD